MDHMYQQMMMQGLAQDPQAAQQMQASQYHPFQASQGGSGMDIQGIMQMLQGRMQGAKNAAADSRINQVDQFGANYGMS